MTQLEYRRAGAWTPPEGVRHHAGVDLAHDDEFFCAPPAEIGQVLSAQTTLKSHVAAWSEPIRMAMALTVGAVLLLGVWLLVNAAGGPGPVLGLIVGSCATGTLLLVTQFKHVCSFVGVAGAARCTLAGSREARPKLELLLFADASEVRTATTRNFYNGVYTGTTYNYTWTDDAGNKRLVLSGQYRSKEGNPKPKNPFHFADAAEVAWCNYLLDRAEEDLKRQGYLQFNLKNGNYVRVGPGFIDLCFGGEVARVTPEEVAELRLAEGTFYVKHKDARWFSRRGKFHFQYGNIGNAKLFVLALEKLVGYQCS